MRHNKLMVTSLLLMLSMICVPLAAQEKPAKSVAKEKGKAKASAAAKSDGSSDDLDAIRHASREFVDAFNSENAKAVAVLWTEDGDYIDEAGRIFAGRESIEKEYAQFFADHDGVKMHVAIDSLRLLSADAAIEDGRAMLEPVSAGAPAISKYTAVHVKVDGKWLLSTVRDLRVETPSAYHSVADLEWLIGTWSAEEHGAKTVAVCRWVANKSFVERSYMVTHHDYTTTSGVQLIGFNPQSGHIQSWNFSSDGGHATGVWSPRENGWQAELHGMTGDGTSTTAVNLLTRIDDNAYAWQSVQRTAGDAALPDTDEVVLKRSPTP